MSRSGRAHRDRITYWKNGNGSAQKALPSDREKAGHSRWWDMRHLPRSPFGRGKKNCRLARGFNAYRRASRCDYRAKLYVPNRVDGASGQRLLPYHSRETNPSQTDAFELSQIYHLKDRWLLGQPIADDATV